MIGRIRGILIEISPPLLLVDVNGVGYEINAPMSTIYSIGQLHREVSLVTHFHIREDAQLLYGFLTEQERVLFRQLIRINGVGPKMALAILSGMDVTAFIHCIRQNDASSLVRLPGVGKKTAERLLIEMRDHIVHFEQDGEQIIALDQRATVDAENALVALGYSQAVAAKAVRTVAEAEMSREQVIRLALQKLSR